MSGIDTSVDPCPWRIVDHTGGGFATGLACGGVFHAFKGFRSAPSGLSRRLYSSFLAVQERAPRMGGQFAAWAGAMGAIHCLLEKLRKKDDPWNFIASGALAGAVVSVRHGPIAMIGSTVTTGVVLTMIAGAQILAAKIEAEAALRSVSSAEKAEAPVDLENMSLQPTAGHKGKSEMFVGLLSASKALASRA